MTISNNDNVETISIVIPVYQGELTLEALLAEIEPLTVVQKTPNGIQFRVSEVIIVHDGAIDDSASIISMLAVSFLLSRRYGWHGISASTPQLWPAWRVRTRPG